MGLITSPIVQGDVESATVYLIGRLFEGNPFLPIIAFGDGSESTLFYEKLIDTLL
jgi:hypothetical protein